MHAAQRVEVETDEKDKKGNPIKESRVVMADGSPAPEHITPAMIQSDWQNVQISLDPKAEVLATGMAKDKSGKMVAKTTYSDEYDMKNAAIKFARTIEGINKSSEIAGEIQKHRADPKTKEQADCAWLMQVQATRPGSESDAKGTAKFFGHRMAPDMVVVTPPEKEGGKSKVEIQVGDERFHVRDEDAANELVKRKELGQDLHDTTFWLKSHGATTLQDRHVIVGDDGSVRLQFMGKESVWHDHQIHDPELAAMLIERKQKSEAAGGSKLFATNDGQVSRYTGKLDGGLFSPKDFRTIRANQLAIGHISSLPEPKDEKEYAEAVKEVGVRVSGVLGNRPQQALSTYIDPAVFSGWRAKLGIIEKPKQAKDDEDS